MALKILADGGSGTIYIRISAHSLRLSKGPSQSLFDLIVGDGLRVNLLCSLEM